MRKSEEKTKIKISGYNRMKRYDEKYARLIITEIMLGHAKNGYYSFIDEYIEVYGVLKKKHFLFLLQRLINSEIIENYSIKKMDVVDLLVEVREELYKLKKKYIDYYEK